MTNFDREYRRGHDDGEMLGWTKGFVFGLGGSILVYLVVRLLLVAVLP